MRYKNALMLKPNCNIPNIKDKQDISIKYKYNLYRCNNFSKYNKNAIIVNIYKNNSVIKIFLPKSPIGRNRNILPNSGMANKNNEIYNLSKYLTFYPAFKVKNQFFYLIIIIHCIINMIMPHLAIDLYTTNHDFLFCMIYSSKLLILS